MSVTVQSATLTARVPAPTTGLVRVTQRATLVTSSTPPPTSASVSCTRESFFRWFNKQKPSLLFDRDLPNVLVTASLCI